VIKVTDEMIEAFEEASGRSVGRDSLAGLAAVLAIFQRDYDVRPARQNLPPCGAEGPDGLHCERNPHTPDSAHGALVNDGLVRW
jgi:hypothetical protein